MKYRHLIVIFSIILMANCSAEKIPEITDWVGLTIKKEYMVEKLIRTAGTGQAEIRWWAGGYTYENGKFGIELIDMDNKKTILKKAYKYNDRKTGAADNERFNWWHSEESEKIILEANHKYKMKIWGVNLAEPGAGWGMWLYRFGEKPSEQAKSQQ